MAWTRSGKLIREIEHIFNETDYFEDAEDLLKELELELSKESFFSFIKEDHKKKYDELTAQYKRKKTFREFHENAKKYNVTGAKESLKKLIEEKMIKKSECKNYERQIEGITEDGLWERIKSAKRAEREGLREIYSSVYPNGKHSRKITTDLIAESFSRVINSIRTNISFEELYEQVHKITQYLENYQNNGVNLARIIDLSEFSKNVQEYVSELKSKGSAEDREIKISKLVRYVKESTNNDPTDIKGREPKIAEGVEGIVIECDDDNYYEGIYTVDFSSEEKEEEIQINQLEEQTAEIIAFESNIKGKKKGKLKKIKLDKLLSQKKSKETAQFYKEELEVREPITEIDRNLVRNELNRIEKLFRERYSSGVQEQYKSQDFPNGINELISK